MNNLTDIKLPTESIIIIRDLIEEEIKNTEKFKSINGKSTDGHIILMREAYIALDRAIFSMKSIGDKNV